MWKPLLHLVLAIFLVCVIHNIVLAELYFQDIVNHNTKECARICHSDECYTCYPPEGWEVLGPGEECPSDYAVVEVEPRIVIDKSVDCCKYGICEDVVSNRITGSCAFVSDMNDCECLPIWWQKWERKPCGGDWTGDYIGCSCSNETQREAYRESILAFAGSVGLFVSLLVLALGIWIRKAKNR